MLLALHLGPPLAKAYRNFTVSDVGLADSDFALQDKLFLHHKGFLEHRENGDTSSVRIWGAGPITV